MGKVKIGRIGHNRVKNWEGRDSMINDEQRNISAAAISCNIS